MVRGFENHHELELQKWKKWNFTIFHHLSMHFICSFFSCEIKMELNYASSRSWIWMKIDRHFPWWSTKNSFRWLNLLQPGVEKSNLFLLFPVLSIIDCLKITEKVLLSIASEASYVHILSEQNFIEKAKNSQFWLAF